MSSQCFMNSWTWIPDIMNPNSFYTQHVRGSKIHYPHHTEKYYVNILWSSVCSLSWSVTHSDPPAEGACALLVSGVICRLGLWSVDQRRKVLALKLLGAFYLWMLEVRPSSDWKKVRRNNPSLSLVLWLCAHWQVPLQQLRLFFCKHHWHNLYYSVWRHVVI